jgi:hypothetical protein
VSCLQKVKEHVEKSGLRITGERLKEFAFLLDQKRADLLTKAAFASEVEKLVQSDLERMAAKHRAADRIILGKREQVVAMVENKTFGADPAENLRSWVEGGSLKKGDSVNLDPARIEASVKADLLRFWRRSIEPFKDIAAQGALNREIYQELDALQRGAQPGASGSQHAVEIAKAVHAVQSKMLELKKAYNPYLEEAKDYLIKRFHDRSKVSAVSAEEWVTDAMKAFGQKSFPELKPEEKVAVFQSIYERIKDGSYGSIVDDSASDKFITVQGTGGNIMRKMSRGRTLQANDWSAAFDYNQKYGYGSVEQTVTATINSAARDIAILDKFGPNPQGMYEGVYARVRGRASAEERLALEQAKPSLDRSFRAASGSLNAPARGQYAKWAQGAMTLQYLAKNGGAIFRSLPDLAVAAGMVRGLNGKTVFQNAGEIAVEYAKAFADSSHRNAALEDLWMFSHSSMQNLMREFGAPDQAGKLGKMAELYSPLTLLPRHVESMRAATGIVVSRQLAKMADLAHADLPATWKDGLLRYGIREPEWDVLRHAVEDWGSMKRGETPVTMKFLNADGVDQIPAEFVENYLRKSGQLEGDASKRVIDLARTQLSYKLGALINEHADYGSTTPGTRQRAFMYRGADANDPMGIALRLMWQFKSAALTTSDAFRRSYFSGEGLKGDWSGVSQTFIMSMFLWTLGEYASQLTAGKTPEDPTSPGFISRAVVGSGAGGMFGEILLSEADRQGVSGVSTGILKNLAGPVVGSAVDAAGIAAQGAKATFGDREKAPWSQLAQWALSQAPGQNLFYTKAAFNFYFANGLKEFAGPGYLGNLERRTMQTPGLLEDRQRYFMMKPMEAPIWPASLR